LEEIYEKKSGKDFITLILLRISTYIKIIELNEYNKHVVDVLKSIDKKKTTRKLNNSMSNVDSILN
jgi:hypothetical protein